MKTSLFLLALSIHASIFGQNFRPVERNEVQKLISDSGSTTYYPKLLSRLQQGDTTLNLEDYRLLYYGFVFQPVYSPYSMGKSTEISAALKDNKFDLAIRYSDESIKQNPMSLTSYYYKLVALMNLDKKDSLFLITRHNYLGLLDAIASSGNGETCKTAFRVIAVSDEYELMYRYFDIKQVKSQLLQTPCDKILIKASESYRKDAIFFDVSESFAAMDKMFKK